MKTLFTGLTPPDADCIHTPLIEIAPVEDDTVLRRALSHLSTYNYLLFTSRFAVRFFLGAMPCCPTLPIVSIGKTTTAALHDVGMKDIIEVEHDNSYGVIDWFSSQPRGRVLIPRSNIALPLIPEGLRNLGFEVDTVTAYINRIPMHPRKVDLTEIDRIVFTSPSTIDNFVRLYGGLPDDKAYVTRGPITQAHLQTYINKNKL